MTTGTAIALGLVVGATLSQALRRIACEAVGLVLGTTSGWGRETWLRHR